MICVQDDQYVIDSLINLCPGWPMGLILVQLFFNQFVPRSTGWRTSWWASRRSWRGSPRSWSRPSPRCPDTSSNRRDVWTNRSLPKCLDITSTLDRLQLRCLAVCPNLNRLLLSRCVRHWNLPYHCQWTDFYHPDVSARQHNLPQHCQKQRFSLPPCKRCLWKINTHFCCHVIIHSVIQWSHKRILSAPR